MQRRRANRSQPRDERRIGMDHDVDRSRPYVAHGHEIEALCEHRNHDLRLHQSELIADALARSAAER